MTSAPTVPLAPRETAEVGDGYTATCRRFHMLTEGDTPMSANTNISGES